MLMKASAQPLRILLVDDNDDVVALFTSVLESVGYKVKAVRTGAQALGLVTSYVPNVVFTSIKVGSVDGFNLCSYLRRMPETANALIVAITGYGGITQTEARATGFDHFLTKPVSLEAILETMQYLDGYRGKNVSSLHAPNGTDAPKA